MKYSVLCLSMLVFAAASANEMIAQKEKTRQQKSGCELQATSNDSTPCLMRGDDPISAMPMTNSFPAAYSCPGNVSLNDGWDIYGDVSYLYWYSKQDAMDVAALGHIYSVELWEPATQNGRVVFQNAEYTSGFRIGIGANLNVDDWVADLTYTYLRNTTTTHSGDATAPAGETPAYNMSAWFLNNYYGGQDVATNFNSKWKMNLDWLDLQFSRPYYQGKRLIVSPSFGLRASWIRQQMRVQSDNLHNAYEYVTPVSSTSSNFSRSWAIGPRGLLNARWIAGYGIRFQGNVGASLLYSQYDVSHRESNLVSSGIPNGGVQVSIDNYSCLRPMAEANLGLGWGRYFGGKSYHLDLSAVYDFNYLWSQNMMRYLNTINSSFAAVAAPGDLVLHGLELTARLDF